MSKICIIIARRTSIASLNADQIYSNIRTILNNYSLGTFIIDPFEEPLKGRYNDCISVSVADNDAFDNCEMFLLPDGNFFNGEANQTRFFERMKVLNDVAVCLNANGCRMELFVGNSGVSYEEYTEVCCKANQVHYVLSEMYYVPEDWVERCLHLKIT